MTEKQIFKEILENMIRISEIHSLSFSIDKCIRSEQYQIAEELNTEKNLLAEKLMTRDRMRELHNMLSDEPEQSNMPEGQV